MGNTLLDRFSEQMKALNGYRTAKEELNGTHRKRRARLRTLPPLQVMQKAKNSSVVVERASQYSSDLQPKILSRDGQFRLRQIKESLFIRNNASINPGKGNGGSAAAGGQIPGTNVKRPEVLPVVAQSSKTLICELRRVFATHGLPDTIASDNGTPFTSSEFGEFLRRNAIRHARVAPYHPSSNGQAERMIQTAKDALRRMQYGDVSQRLASFLLSQHTLPCVATGRSLAELLMNRRLRSRLDRLHPDWSSERQREIEDNAPKTKPRFWASTNQS
ncbi:hypothetical protein M514_19663 [Trichuris suis]|uniref:Integrase catalytic domain-containing protein n=1 Tax=Trichuris suis TaxID=68888 RepID=A0A085NFD5_9BILA|nr:hypothetical protein M514_19663 [Trichuris suis]